jgi:imidazolonepropionase-like amidohydrolase
MTRFIISNVTAVKRDEVIKDSRIVVEDGIVVEIGPSLGNLGETFDGRGAFCIPGIVDTHIDDHPPLDALLEQPRAQREQRADADRVATLGAIKCPELNGEFVLPWISIPHELLGWFD